MLVEATGSFDMVTVCWNHEPLEPEASLDSVRVTVSAVRGGPALSIQGMRIGQPGTPATVAGGRAGLAGQPPDSAADDEIDIRRTRVSE